MKREPFAPKRERRRGSSLSDAEERRPRTPYDDTSLAGDDWDGPPAEGPWFKWGLGMAAPLVLWCYGIAVLVTREAHWHGRYPFDLYGANAVAYGAVALSLAMFLHCHYFWGNLYDNLWQAELGKIVGLIGFVGGLGTLIVRVGVLGGH